MNTRKMYEKENSVSSTIRKSIIEHILKKGSFLVSEIAEDTGYSITTIGKYVTSLLAEGTIQEIEKINLHAKGRKAIRYGTQNDGSYFLGVDPRPYELHIGLIDVVGNLMEAKVYPEYVTENTYESFEHLCNIIDQYIKELPEGMADKIKAANVNISGRVNPAKGTSATLFNFEGSESESLAETLSQRFNMPVYIENDTKAMTYGEYVTSIKQPDITMCYVNFSWGIGLGLVINGKIYYGKDGYSGEIGHVHAFDNNVLCHCGKKGCLETEISGSAIARHLKERVLNGETSLLAPAIKAGKNITTTDIINAIEKEDSLCLELTSDVASKLGHALASLVNILNPDLIVIGGNFSQVEACYFLEPIKLAIRQYSLKLVSKDLPIISASLGVEAGVAGACLIARSRYYGLADTI